MIWPEAGYPANNFAEYPVLGLISGIRPDIWYSAGYLVFGRISGIQPDIRYSAGYLIFVGQISGIRPDIWPDTVATPIRGCNSLLDVATLFLQPCWPGEEEAASAGRPCRSCCRRPGQST